MPSGWKIASWVSLFLTLLYTFIYFVCVDAEKLALWQRLILGVVAPILGMVVLHIINLLLGNETSENWLAAYAALWLYTAIQVAVPYLFDAGLIWVKLFALYTCGALFQMKSEVERKPRYEVLNETICFNYLAILITTGINMYFLENNTVDKDFSTIICLALPVCVGHVIMFWAKLASCGNNCMLPCLAFLRNYCEDRCLACLRNNCLNPCLTYMRNKCGTFLEYMIGCFNFGQDGELNVPLQP